jgi:hypothetical protein
VLASEADATPTDPKKIKMRAKRKSSFKVPDSCL